MQPRKPAGILGKYLPKRASDSRGGPCASFFALVFSFQSILLAFHHSHRFAAIRAGTRRTFHGGNKEPRGSAFTLADCHLPLSPISSSSSSSRSPRLIPSERRSLNPLEPSGRPRQRERRTGLCRFKFTAIAESLGERCGMEGTEGMEDREITFLSRGRVFANEINRDKP